MCIESIGILGHLAASFVRFPLFRCARARQLARQPRQEHSGLPAAGYAALGSSDAAAAGLSWDSFVISASLIVFLENLSRLEQWQAD